MIENVHEALRISNSPLIESHRKSFKRHLQEAADITEKFVEDIVTAVRKY